MNRIIYSSWLLSLILAVTVGAGDLAVAVSEKAEWWKPYSAPCVERENVFAFTEAPIIKDLGRDKYEITFAVKGACDVTVAIVDVDGKVVRHLGSGVLGANAPAPFQKHLLKQKIYWNGKDDLDVYIQEPESLSVRVMLGLKPVFDKRLGGESPHNLPGYVCGIVVGPKGAVVLSKKWRLVARRFDLNGEYQMSLLPPPADLPETKLSGMGYVEYEPGKKAVHGPDAYDTVSDRGWMFWGVDHGGLGDVQPVLYDDKIYFAGFNGRFKGLPASLYYLKLDGSTDFKGVRGDAFTMTTQRFPRFAVSPDGKWLYMIGVNSSQQFVDASCDPGVFRRLRSGDGYISPFIGLQKKHGRGLFSPGEDNSALNMPAGLDCDAEGRLYVCDYGNNRVQIFSPEGEYLKTVPVDRPLLIKLHQKTGAMYVLHTGRRDGKSVGRVTKFRSFSDPTEIFHTDGIVAGVMALDSWSVKPRLWLGGGEVGGGTGSLGMKGGAQSVVIYEENENGFKKILDFDERAKRDDGPFYYGRWRNEKGGSGGNTRLDCDPIRERAYYHTNLMFDLPTGHFLGRWRAAPHRSIIDDIAFDKRGYMHVHFNPGFYLPGVGRVDPKNPKLVTGPEIKGKLECYPEVPYDYGVTGGRHGRKEQYWQGIIPVMDQKGAHWFQFGLGVNMRGDLAVASQIYYVPKMEDTVMSEQNSGMKDRRRTFGYNSTGGITFAKFMKDILDKQRRGIDVYSISRRPGVSLSGTTIWTYDSSGELRAKCAANIGRLINGVEIDEDGDLYFYNDRIRMINGAPFLAGKGGTFGGPIHMNNRNPMTGTLFKTRGEGVRILLSDAVVAMDPEPKRLHDLISTGHAMDKYDDRHKAWVEGAKWMYAGASPMRFRACKCPSIRFHTDWYKRTFAPEAYRHSIGVLDTNGNLVMHIGQYGNFDSASGPKSKIPVGKDGIAVFHPRAVSATDNYIVYSSWGEWVTVLKIEYHAEETIPIVVN